MLPQVKKKTTLLYSEVHSGSLNANTLLCRVSESNSLLLNGFPLTIPNLPQNLYLINLKEEKSLKIERNKMKIKQKNLEKAKTFIAS